MQSIIKTYKYENNEIQKVQVVECDNWKDLDFFKPKISKEALKHLAAIYQDFFVAKYPYIFGEMIVYHIPDDIDLPFSVKGIKDKHIASKIYLSKNRKSKISKDFIELLRSKGYLYTVKGKNKFMHSFMPFKSIGFMSDSVDSSLKVNSSFFTFDLIDSQSPYDIYGTPIGLYVKDGKILNPPLYDREAFLVDKDGNVEIKKINLEDIDISIKGKIYQRPSLRRTPKSKGFDIVVISDEVVYINKGGNTTIPSSGFVINTNDETIKVNDKVEYKGLENIVFGIQCGNSAIINNEKTTKFMSEYYNLKSLSNTVYPPSNYPLDYDNARAPRIVLGQNQNNKPVIIWFEGASKMKHVVGEDSVGASLKEVADIVKDLGIKNAINLDGGGSAQILLDNKRSLKISDRDFSDNSESERPVPIGIIIK